MTVDQPDWMPDAQSMVAEWLGVTTQIAGLIATGDANGTPGGVPLLTLNNVLDKQNNVTLTHGQSYSSPNLVINQPSYDFVLEISYSAVTTQPWALVTLSWQDTAIGVANFQFETWMCIGGNNGVNIYGGRGLSKGSQLDVTIQNLDPAQSMLFSYGIAQHSRIVARDDIRSVAYNTPGILGGVSCDPGRLVLANWTPNVAAGGNANAILPLFAGKAEVYMPEALTASRMVLRDAAADADPSMTITQDIFYDTGAIAVNGVVHDVVTLPRSNVRAELLNTGGAASNINLIVNALEY